MLRDGCKLSNFVIKSTHSDEKTCPVSTSTRCELMNDVIEASCIAFLSIRWDTCWCVV